ncbi:hypothetical protein [Ruegeria sp. HKCCD6109]|uniref:hypothetical protein n=1 Tax=Ruegeria sp. HKCCD6109 TaxID=2683017 RepID=UPI0014919628|nr:hypothetical protein [Ruegeria sp. HKCCD6109]NOD65760.1 hypothetical protein [Ruegeria sp. HKCCD6109]
MALCNFEKDVLRMFAGEPQDTIKGWGAGLGAALEPLKNGGFIDRAIENGAMRYFITDKGRAAIAEKD